MVIWKFKLAIRFTQSIMVPKGSTILSLAVQKDDLCIWALVDPDAGSECRTIQIFGTNEKIKDPLVGTKRLFIGTVIMSYFVWHVFELVDL